MGLCVGYDPSAEVQEIRNIDTFITWFYKQNIKLTPEPWWPYVGYSVVGVIIIITFFLYEPQWSRDLRSKHFATVKQRKLPRVYTFSPQAAARGSDDATTDERVSFDTSPKTVAAQY